MKPHKMPELVGVLTEGKHDVNVRTDEGITPLMVRYGTLRHGAMRRCGAASKPISFLSRDILPRATSSLVRANYLSDIALGRAFCCAVCCDGRQPRDRQLAADARRAGQRQDRSWRDGADALAHAKAQRARHRRAAQGRRGHQRAVQGRHDGADHRELAGPDRRGAGAARRGRGPDPPRAPAAQRRHRRRARASRRAPPQGACRSPAPPLSRPASLPPASPFRPSLLRFDFFRPLGYLSSILSSHSLFFVCVLCIPACGCRAPAHSAAWLAACLPRVSASSVCRSCIFVSYRSLRSPLLWCR